MRTLIGQVPKILWEQIVAFVRSLQDVLPGARDRMKFFMDAAANALDDKKGGMLRNTIAPAVDGFFEGLLVLIEGLENL